MEYFKLNNNLEIPALVCGTNTYGHETGRMSSPWNHDYSPVIKAVKAGFRCIDTSMVYRNEEGIGLALRDCGVSREELTIIGKLRIAPEIVDTPEHVKENFKKSLKKLKLDYIDYYLLHRPWNDENQMAEAWLALKDLEKEGLLRGMALSNFSPNKIDRLVEMTSVKPAFNQYSYNSTGWKFGFIPELEKRGIANMAWGSLSISNELRALLSGIAEKYGKTWSQIMLRHNFQKGIISVVKSHSFEHSAENLDIFGFALSDDDMKAIDDFIESEQPLDPSIFM